MHYDTKDGLAGSTAYAIAQDADGFIWFATETGLSRYDGSRFVNFTVEDGLPDNEVLELFNDSRGRMWIGTITNKLCYYKKGVFYTAESDSMLQQIKLNSGLRQLIEIGKDTLLATDGSVLYCIEHNKITQLGNGVIDTNGEIIQIGWECNGELIVKFYSNAWYYSYNKSNHTFTRHNIYNEAKGLLVNKIAVKKKFINGDLVITRMIDRKPGINNMSASFDNQIYINTSDGTWILDTATVQWINHYLPEKKVNRTVKDNENNYWFATLGDGVYKLPSTNAKTFSFSTYDNNTSNVFSLADVNNRIYCGLTFSKLAVLNNYSIEQVYDYEKYRATAKNDASKNQGGVNRLLSIKVTPNNDVLLGFDNFLVKRSHHETMANEFFAIKQIALAEAGSLLLATSRGAYRVSLANLKATDTLFPNRTTTVYYLKGQNYIGTPTGLFVVPAGQKKASWLGEINAGLSRRIVSLAAKGDVLWVATSDAGVVAVENGKVIYTITKRQGLASDICKTLHINSNELWVGTNNGISKIDLLNPRSPIINYGVADGLVSNTINAILVKDSIVWVGSPHGLSYINPAKVIRSSRCNLVITSISIAGKVLPQDVDSITISYKTNNIRFQFAAISMQSAGEITYRYQLAGLSDQWIETKQNSINYGSLPSGEYTFIIYAVNKFGIRSKEQRFFFVIETPWWRTTPMIVLGILSLVALVWFIINWRYKALAKTNEERIQLKEQIANLEQQALRSQMNPHFIFNCLNSIQGFIINSDLKTTSRYLHAFSSLLRKTLDTTGKQVITIADEIDYLTNYLQLEQMRFGEKFHYSFEVEDGIAVDFTFIPNMILQPFIENSIRHGIRYKKADDGHVWIIFRQTTDHLICEVRDNGIGMQQAGTHKTTQHIEYQSKGMELTLNRLALLGQKYNATIQTHILNNNEAAAEIGTRVILSFPLLLINQLNNEA